jgi:methanogenic corrinoid protein MtbC1
MSKLALAIDAGFKTVVHDIREEAMRNIVEALEGEGLRNDVKIVIGGAPVTQQFAESIGADAYGENAFKAVEICKNLVKK